ncbi:MAG TPA: hypothetical protein ACFCUD_15190 [Cyclobacteriaceae bacterium]
MAKANPEIIVALRKTAEKLEKGASYQWGHMGACNCGNLAQQLLHISKAKIHEYAMLGKGDWTDQVEDYCPTSKYPMDLMISELLNKGLTRQDLQNLEKLSDKEVLMHMTKKYPAHNSKNDVTAYLKAWANLLEKEYLEKSSIEDFVFEASFVRS